MSDIENALDFLDSEEFREVRKPIPHTKNEIKKQCNGEVPCDASKPIRSKIDSIKPPKQENSTIKAGPDGTARPSPRIKKEPPKIASGQLNRPKMKTSGKIWFFCLGTAALIVFAILVLYGMGYLFSGP